MSRDGSGNYTLPLPDVITGTTIESSWANTTLADIEVEMTDSLSRSGSGGMQSALRLIDGVKAAPGLSFVNEASGLYRETGNDLRMSVNGVDQMRWTASGVQIWDETGAVWKDIVLGPSGASDNDTLRYDATAGEWAANSNFTVTATGDVTAIGNVAADTISATSSITVDGSTGTGVTIGDGLTSNFQPQLTLDVGRVINPYFGANTGETIIEMGDEATLYKLKISDTDVYQVNRSGQHSFLSNDVVGIDQLTATNVTATGNIAATGAASTITVGEGTRFIELSAVGSTNTINNGSSASLFKFQSDGTDLWYVDIVRNELISHGEIIAESNMTIGDGAVANFQPTLTFDMGETTEPAVFANAATMNIEMGSGASTFKILKSGTERFSVNQSGDAYVDRFLYVDNSIANLSGNLVLNDTVEVSTLSTNGPVYSNLNVLTNTNPSDERLKENIEEIDDQQADDAVIGINPVTFTWIDQKNGKGVQHGFLAQDVQNYLPALVSEEPDGMLGLKSDQLVPVLWQVVRNLMCKVDALEEQLAND